LLHFVRNDRIIQYNDCYEYHQSSGAQRGA